MELTKTFDPKAAEARWYEQWVDRGYFTADPARPGPAFSIVIPPPNVTGQLHLGHALNVTLHDIIVRMRRMQGYNTLWIPGTDHAGIATQNAVERDLAREGTNRHQLGREQFVARVWQWRDDYGGKILHQLRKLGASCDWTRERFTLDEGLSKAVAEVFVRLYREGLIYRDRQLINWCPRCETALSDLEVEHRESEGQLYYVRYPLSAGGGEVTVATTRPETMLGDTAVAVNPADERYVAVIGHTLTLPIVGRIIPIIADAMVQSDFGTGAVKITPAHDFNDLQIGRRHNLDEIAVIDHRGKMNAAAGEYAGLTREECRKALVGELQARGLLERVEPHRHAVGICSRCDTVLEPMLSDQWFVRVKPLAERAVAAVREGRTTFHPRFWENTYFNWMENVHDWCISRQLWWGHRIPAYYCDRCAHVTVASHTPPACEQCAAPNPRQDEDVLDTWFSSALWPFSTLGWPERTADFDRYYPTSLLVTGFDIIFFWVARMMMMGLWFAGDVPFRDVYITPLVRDKFGKKMTKSRGNVVDPLVIMDTYGTDAVRFTLAQLSVQGRDLVLSDDRMAAAKAFANKIWNAARFILMNLEDQTEPPAPVAPENLELAARWILSRLHAAVADVTQAIEAYEFNTAAARLYDFIWHEFCDWYIELSKQAVREGQQAGAAARYVLVHCCDQLLRLLHPFMPFLTEEVWQALRPYLPNREELPLHLAVAEFPRAGETLLSTAERRAMTHCLETTEAINSLRSLLGYHPGQRVSARLRPLEADGAGQVAAEFGSWRRYAMAMARAEELEIIESTSDSSQGMVTSVLDWCEISLAAPAGFDIEKAREALRRKLKEIGGHLEQHRNRLANPDFQAKAAPEMRDQIEQRAAELEGQHRLLCAQLELLGGAPL